MRSDKRKRQKLRRQKQIETLAQNQLILQRVMNKLIALMVRLDDRFERIEEFSDMPDDFGSHVRTFEKIVTDDIPEVSCNMQTDVATSCPCLQTALPAQSLEDIKALNQELQRDVLINEQMQNWLSSECRDGGIKEMCHSMMKLLVEEEVGETLCYTGTRKGDVAIGRVKMAKGSFAAQDPDAVIVGVLQGAVRKVVKHGCQRLTKDDLQQVTLGIQEFFKRAGSTGERGSHQRRQRAEKAQIAQKAKEDAQKALTAELQGGDNNGGDNDRSGATGISIITPTKAVGIEKEISRLGMAGGQHTLGDRQLATITLVPQSSPPQQQSNIPLAGSSQATAQVVDLAELLSHPTLQNLLQQQILRMQSQSGGLE
jgi:hypothetical protein